MTTRKALSALYYFIWVTITLCTGRNNSIGITAPEVIRTRPAELTMMKFNINSCHTPPFRVHNIQAF